MTEDHGFRTKHMNARNIYKCGPGWPPNTTSLKHCEYKVHISMGLGSRSTRLVSMQSVLIIKCFLCKVAYGLVLSLRSVHILFALNVNPCVHGWGAGAHRSRGIGTIWSSRRASTSLGAPCQPLRIQLHSESSRFLY